MWNQRGILGLAVAGLLVALLAGSLRAAPKGQETTVTIKNLAFLPATVTIKVGDTVTWINADDRDHTVLGDNLKSGNIKPGRTYSQVFNKPGTYNYGCSYHPRMRGTITVTAAGDDKDKGGRED